MQAALDKKLCLQWAIALLLPLIILCAPVNGLFTHDLKIFLIITTLVIGLMAMELVPIIISSVLMGTMYTLSGIVSPQTAFACWTETAVWMIFGGFLFSAILEQCGLLQRIAYSIICRCGGTFNGAVIGVFIIGIILNIITFCNGWIVSCVLVYGVCKAMNLEKSQQAALICFSGAIGSNGSVIYLYHPAFVSLLEKNLQQYLGQDYMMGIFTPFQYIGWAVPCCLISIFIFMKLYHTGNLDEKFSKKLFEEKLAALGPMSRQEKIAVVFIIILLTYLVTCQYTRLPAAYGFMVVPYLMFIPGINLGNAETIRRMNLSTIFFIAACFGIGIVGAEVGFGDFVTALSVPVLEGHSTLTICLFFMALGTLANLIMTPFAMLGCLVLPFCQIAVTLDINPIAACMILQYTIDMVFLPHEASGNLIMYSYGLWPMRDFIIQNTIKTIINAIVFILIMYPLWNMFDMI